MKWLRLKAISGGHLIQLLSQAGLLSILIWFEEFLVEKKLFWILLWIFFKVRICSVIYFIFFYIKKENIVHFLPRSY